MYPNVSIASKDLTEWTYSSKSAVLEKVRASFITAES